MIFFRVRKKLSSFLTGRQKVRMAELFLLMIVGGFLEMLSVSVIVPFLTAIMDSDAFMEKWYAKLIMSIFRFRDDRSLLTFFSFTLAGLYIVKNVYLLFQKWAQNRFIYNSMFRVQKDVFAKLLMRPYEYFLYANSGELLRTINTDILEVFRLLESVLTLMTEIIVSVCLLGTVFIISPLITAAVGGVLLVLVLLITIVIQPRVKILGKNQMQSRRSMNAWLLEAVQGIKEIKIMKREGYFQRNFNKHSRDSTSAIQKHNVIALFPRYLIEMVAMSILFLTIGILILKGMPFDKLIPPIAAIAMASVRLLPSMNRISEANANMSYREPMLDSLLRHLANEEKGPQPEALPPSGKKGEARDRRIGPLKEEIRFSDITFRYANTEEDIFTGASMTIKRGESVGIVGASGAGKTTSVDILLGLLKPQGGQILVDGVDIREDMEGWLGQIGYIPQSIFMLDDSIRANVAFGVPEEKIDDERVMKALHDASLDEFIRSLPEGIHSKIGERGVRISGGQRQRIGIARALYSDPSVLVFDEATSALDNATETDIMQSINSLHGQKTMIIIAHRLTTIESCDHVYRMGDKKITAER